MDVSLDMFGAGECRWNFKRGERKEWCKEAGQIVRPLLVEGASPVVRKPSKHPDEHLVENGTKAKMQFLIDNYDGNVNNSSS
ncbi:hypothetical protein C4D60_Mb01t28750 [Musa balbisiana]|uniref:Uncharacterized protein n=1 Tax=Musa balbisiana TaxID=52838 RepID=A0A4V4H7Q7_MUSBA|nr:hypothetical protein C4D60_Mb01t28750 [Musa balbisiana]